MVSEKVSDAPAAPTEDVVVVGQAIVGVVDAPAEDVGVVGQAVVGVVGGKMLGCSIGI